MSTFNELGPKQIASAVPVFSGFLLFYLRIMEANTFSVSDDVRVV
jgi:hypothetical protein